MKSLNSGYFHWKLVWYLRCVRAARIEVSSTKKGSGAKGGCWQSLVRIGFFLGWIFVLQDVVSLYSSVVERQSCKLKVLGSIPSGGFLPSFNYVCLQVMSSWCMSSVIACGVFVCGGFERGLLLAMTFFENLIPPPTSQSSIFACNFKTSQIRFPGLAWERTYRFLAR